MSTSPVNSPANTPVDTSQATRSAPRNPIWMVIAGIVVVALLAFMFVELSAGRLRHRVQQDAPPAGATPTPGPSTPVQPAPVPH